MLTLHARKTLGDFHLDIALQTETEIVVLLGPSGAGKSLTLQSVAGLVTPDTGRIELDGRTLFDSTAGINLPPQQRRVGYVFQNYALFPHLTVAKNIGYGLHALPKSQRAARVAEVIDLVRLAGLEDRHPHQLSGGQQQRVALARALAVEPEILLLDEPFAALDAPIRARLRQEFRALQQRLGIPALFVTHDLEEAAVLASRIAVVIDGRIHQYGPTREILDHPANRQVAELVRAGNILPGTIRDGSVNTAIGTLPVRDLNVPDGSAVEVVIRSEAIGIVTIGEAGIPGIIEDVIDHGARIAVLVNVNGTTLEATTSPAAARQLALSAGQQVTLVIHPEDVHVIASGS